MGRKLLHIIILIIFKDINIFFFFKLKNNHFRGNHSPWPQFTSSLPRLVSGWSRVSITSPAPVCVHVSREQNQRGDNKKLWWSMELLHSLPCWAPCVANVPSQAPTGYTGQHLHRIFVKDFLGKPSGTLQRLLYFSNRKTWNSLERNYSFGDLCWSLLRYEAFLVKLLCCGAWRGAAVCPMSGSKVMTQLPIIIFSIGLSQFGLTVL